MFFHRFLPTFNNECIGHNTGKKKSYAFLCLWHVYLHPAQILFYRVSLKLFYINSIALINKYINRIFHLSSYNTPPRYYKTLPQLQAQSLQLVLNSLLFSETFFAVIGADSLPLPWCGFSIVVFPFTPPHSEAPRRSRPVSSFANSLSPSLSPESS